MALLPPSPLLDDTITPGQLGHISDHEEIHRILNDIVNVDTWDAMQAVTPEDGARWYATDQGVDYIAVGGAWVRMTGDPKDVWVTDYGWKCDNDTGSAAGNATALNAAYAASIAAAGVSINRTIVIPEAPGFTTAYVTGEFSFEQVTIRGVGGTHNGKGQVRIAHTGSNGTNAVFVTDDNLAGARLENLDLIAHNCAVRVKNSANVKLTNFSGTVSNTGLARNHPLEIQNTFSLVVDDFTLTSGDTADATIGIYATDGGAVGGIAEAYFSHGILNLGGIYFENQLTIGGGPLSGAVKFEDVFTENQAGTVGYLTVRSTGSAGHGFDGWQFINAARFDPSAGSCAFFDFDADGQMNFLRFTIIGQAAATYLIKSIDQTSLGGWNIESLSSSQTLFDPTSTTTNVYGMKVGDKFGHGHAVRGNMNAAAGASAWSGGISDSGYRVGKAIGETHARGMWRESDGALSMGSGSAVHDIYLRRSAASTFTVDADGAGGAATLAVGTASVGTVTNSTTLVVQTTASAAIQFKANSAQKAEINTFGLLMSAASVLQTAASTSGIAGFRLPHGTAPSSPGDGDMWTTTAGLFVRINGVTVGPLS